MSKAAASEPAAERAFKLIEAAAAAGLRCPMNDELPGGNLSIRTLALAGRIKVEVGQHNYRIAVVLAGPHSGRSTRKPDDGIPWRPYLVVDKKGTRRPRYNPPAPPVQPQSGSSSVKTTIGLRAPEIVAAAQHETGNLAGALRELRALGLSFQKCADTLGITKNSAIGIANRNGMLATTIASPSRCMEFPGPGRCVWPIGDPREPDFAFCGERADAGPYCARHHKSAYLGACD